MSKSTKERGEETTTPFVFTSPGGDISSEIFYFLELRSTIVIYFLNWKVLSNFNKDGY